MPLEGHWERQQAPLGVREVRVMAVIAGALAVAAAVVIAVSVLGGSSSPQAGCIDVVVPSTTGGASAHACGSDAARLCSSARGNVGRDARATQAACRRAGF